ncbi:hypothetical protein HNO89_000034 [Sporosarcina luteola]|nr:hypothetical protein [Sporosarcina luteola]
MKKVIPLVAFLMPITFFTIFSYSQVQSKTLTENEIQQRDDIILDLLWLSTNQAIEKHFGKPKQFYCEKVIEIEKKKEPSYFNVTVQLITFEGAHDFPFDLVTITFSNRDTIEWRAIDIKSRTLKPDEVTNMTLNCW